MAASNTLSNPRNNKQQNLSFLGTSLSHDSPPPSPSSRLKLLPLHPSPGIPKNERRRKMSVPVALYRNTPRLSVSNPSGVGLPIFERIPGQPNPMNLDIGDNLSNTDPDANRARLRRFSNVGSNVGDAARKLSTTIGWRTVSVQDIVCQTKSLCGQYIRARLKRSGILHRKFGLQRMRSVANLPGGVIVCEIFSQLHLIGTELERMHPKLYVDICKQVAVTITNEKSVRGVLSSIAQELLKTDITWGKIISLYCVAGGLAVDCVHHGHPEYLFGLIEAMGLVVERDAAAWIAQQGGWTGLLSHHRPPDDEAGVFQMLALSVLCLIVLLAGLIFLLRIIGSFALG